MKRKIVKLLGLSMLTFVVACGGDVEEEAHETETNEEVEALEEVIEEDIVPEKPEMSEFIKGTWGNVASDCDAEGNGCKYKEGSDWVFDGSQVTLGNAVQEYYVSNDTIYIVDSPYYVEKEMGDTILMHAIKTDRFMKLLRK